MKKGYSFLFIFLILLIALPVIANTPAIYFENQQIGTAVQIDGDKYYTAPDILGRALKIPIVIGDPSGNVRVDKILLEKLAIRIPSGWLVPIQEIAEALGYKYIYDRNKEVVNIFTGNIPPTNEPQKVLNNKYKNETANNDTIKAGKVAILDPSGRNRRINDSAGGEALDIEKYLMRGKTNIFVFYSDY